VSFPRYPSYKDSGVEWLQQVPEHWEVKCARAVGVFSSSGIDKKLVEGEQSVQMFNYLDVYKSTDKILRHSNELMWTTTPAEKVVDHAVVEGDILLTPSSETEDDIGHAARVSDVPKNVVFSYHLVRFRTGKLADSAYLTYSFNAALIRSYFESVCTGTTRMVLVREDFKNAPIALPPLAEQTAIAAFLDRETGKIDELVAEQRRLMELLKEKRRAVISHAVTRGLNPAAPLKPSGIEWLGDVPKHWEVKPLKYLMSLTSGGTPRKENLAYWDGTVPWASSKDLKPAELFDTQDHITQKALDDGAAELVPAGTILTVVRGMILLHTFPVVVARVPMAINQDLKAILPTAGVNADFLAWLLRGASAEVLSRTDEAGHGTKVLRLESWLAMYVPVPPPEEQTLIVANIIKRLAELDALTAEAQRAIDLLQERRTALISAGVTGQIDVRKQTAKKAA
jgi:type I restriction enzyme S subunit